MRVDGTFQGELVCKFGSSQLETQSGTSAVNSPVPRHKHITGCQRGTSAGKLPVLHLLFCDCPNKVWMTWHSDQVRKSA